jgi:hydrogenase maturation protease
MKKNVIIGLGNDILGDDAIGLITARRLKNFFNDTIDVFESPNGGLELLDYLEGYENALILDSLYTNKYPSGYITVYSVNDFIPFQSSTPHYIGLPEVVNIAKELNISIPKNIIVLLMEVENPYELSTNLSNSVENNQERYYLKSLEIINSFK